MDTNKKKIRTSNDWNALFKTIYARYYSKLCSFARMFVSNNEEAEEIVQNSILKLWEQRHNIDTIDNLNAYLFRSVKNHCLNAINHKKIEEKYKSQAWTELKMLEIQSLETDTNEGLREIQLKNAIHELPERCKEVLILSKFDGLKNKEIAQKLDISIKAVEASITRAFTLLRKKIK